MSDKNKKNSLEQAMIDFANIQKFAEEQAAAQIKEQVSEKLKNLFEEKLNEDITITISGDGVSVDGAEVSDHEGIESHEEMPTHDMGLEVPNGDGEEEFSVSDEDDEISVEDQIEEIIQNENEGMNNMQMEEEAAAAALAPTPAPAADATAAPVDAAAAPATEEMTEETPGIPEMISKLDTLINIMMQQQGGEATGTPGEEDFEVIDDEAGAQAPAGEAPAAAPAAAAPAPAPVQEEEIDIVDFEDDNNHKNFIDEMENEMIEIVDEDEVPMEGMSMEETRSLGFASKRTGDKKLKMDTMKDEKGHHAPVTSLKENKAQKESIADELIKENESLKNKVKELQSDRKEFEEAFVELRKQFNEMQTFNGKLALVNQVLMKGGLTTDEKVKICEQFDQAETFEEANKLYKNIMKESVTKSTNNVTDKLKSTTTNTAKAKSTSEPLYESEEARRLKRLAGIIKSEDEN